MSTKWTVAALSGLIANARVALALSVAHVYLSFIGQPRAVAANASLLTALVLAGLAMCYVPVDSQVSSDLQVKGDASCTETVPQMESHAGADPAAGHAPFRERSTCNVS